MQTENTTNSAKLVFTGPFASGKTSLVERIINNSDTPINPGPTLGSTKNVKNLQIKNKTYVLEIWDLSGDPQYESLIKPYFANNQLVFIVLDVTSQTWKEDLQKFYEFSQEKTNNWSQKKLSVNLILNKVDLLQADQRIERVIEIEGEISEQKYQISHVYKLSLLQGDGVADFLTALQKLVKESCKENNQYSFYAAPSTKSSDRLLADSPALEVKSEQSPSSCCTSCMIL